MSSSFSFEKIKQIEQSHKDIVFGYIRKHETKWMDNISYRQHLPELIQCTILLFYYSTIDSSILTPNECDTFIKLLEEKNKFKNIGRYEYSLIYSSKQHGFSERIFKDKCHEKKHILCFIHSKTGNVFGGYTASGWFKDKLYGQHDEEAFIFSIRSDRDYPARIFSRTGNEGASIWNQNGYYCVFGGDCAFYITADHKNGSCNRSKCRNFEEYPHNFYLTEKPFDVEGIEAFQLN